MEGQKSVIAHTTIINTVNPSKIEPYTEPIESSNHESNKTVAIIIRCNFSAHIITYP